MQRRRPPELSAALRRLGNPYAAIQFEDEEDELQLRPLTVSERSYVRVLGNQYAPLSIGIFDNQEKIPSARVRSKGVPVVAFVAECKRIFRQYIPMLEKGRLRQHHLDFIERNRGRTAVVRDYLLSELRRYDLSSAGVFQGQFNREKLDVSADKLRQIEIKVVGDK